MTGLLVFWILENQVKSFAADLLVAQLCSPIGQHILKMLV